MKELNILILDPQKLDLESIDEFKNQGVEIDNLEFILICPEKILDENEKLFLSDTFTLRKFVMRAFHRIEWKRLFYKNKIHAVGLGFKD